MKNQRNTPFGLTIFAVAMAMGISACGIPKSALSDAQNACLGASSEAQLFDSLGTGSSQTITMSNSSGSVVERTSGDDAVFCRKTTGAGSSAYACWSRFSSGASAQQTYNSAVASAYGVYVQNLVGGPNVTETLVVTSGVVTALCQKSMMVYPGATASYACFHRLVCN
jgi:hypothetical protein